MLAGGIVYLGGGPAIHLAHRRQAAAGWSLFRRVDWRLEPPNQAAAPADRADATSEPPARWAPVLAFGHGRASLGLAVTF
jgi:hypothetical protein